MSHSPCHHDCSDFSDDEETRDHGCCSPIPIRRDCLRPVLPVPECDEEDATMEFDPETEEFFALGKLYDSTCSPLSDSTGSILTALVA
jgi:hypothetical protein